VQFTAKTNILLKSKNFTKRNNAQNNLELLEDAFEGVFNFIEDILD
jgi:hypothetical protein